VVGERIFAGPVNTTIRVTRLPGVKNDDTNSSQNVPSVARVAAGAFGFLTFSLDGPDLYFFWERRK